MIENGCHHCCANCHYGNRVAQSEVPIPVTKCITEKHNNYSASVFSPFLGFNNNVHLPCLNTPIIVSLHGALKYNALAVTCKRRQR